MSTIIDQYIIEGNASKNEGRDFWHLNKDSKREESAMDIRPVVNMIRPSVKPFSSDTNLFKAFMADAVEVVFYKLLK